MWVARFGFELVPGMYIALSSGHYHVFNVNTQKIGETGDELGYLAWDV